MLYLTKGGSWLSFGHVVAMISGFLISIAFANLLAKESFGIYKFVLSMGGVLAALSLTGIGIAVTQAVARGFGSALSKGFRTNLKWSFLIVLGGLALSVYYYINDNTLLALSFILVAIFSPIIASANLYSSYLSGKKDFRRNALYGMIHNIAPAVALILALFVTENILIILTTYFFFGALVSLFLYYKTTRTYANENGNEDSELFVYSGHLSLMNVIARVTHHLDKILIFHFLGAAPLAIYAFAIAPVDQLQAGKKILSRLILPKVSGRPFAELQQSAPRKAFILALYALGLAGIYVLIAPYFFGFFYPQYLDSILYSQIYSLTLLAISGTIFNEIMLAHKKKKELYVLQTIVPIIKLALFVTLLPLFGLMGLIVSHVITKCFSGILGYYFVQYPFKR